jgi:nucleotide-binding universal stress UspA family protein
LKHALDLANQCKALVIGLHVITNMGLFTAVHAMTLSENKWPNEVRDLMKGAKAIVTDETPYEGIVIGGENAGSDIVTFSDSKNNGIDLIVMCRKGSNFLKDAILGSTTNLVLHKSETPMLVIK